MTRYTTNLTLAVAALGFAAATASAQTNMLKAEIPFAFRVGKQLMQPGTYHVTILTGYSGSLVYRLTNVDVSRSVLAVPMYRAAPAKEWTASHAPRMSFVCSDGPCNLNRIWTGEGDACQFHTPRGKYGEPHIAEILLRPERAE